MKNPKISVVTLGCSKNIVDSEVLLGRLKLHNATIVEDVEQADIAVINTCGFIEAAKQESVDVIVEAVERKNLGKLKKVVVMGCLSERYRDQLRAEVAEVDAIFGSNEIPGVAAELGVDYKTELLGERFLTTPKHFAYLKISEGCDRPCSFCAIPLMRGGHRSRSSEGILAEAAGLAAQGVRELIVIGQDTTYYGLDLHGERRLHKLMESLGDVKGLDWIRLMYAYPSGFPLEVLRVMKNHSNMCRYLDIPLQHASDAVLSSMRRGITNAGTRALLEHIREEIPDVAIRTTFIVGYPNETEADFELLYNFVKETRFHRLGVFPYSMEEGTFSEKMGDPVPSEVKEERVRALMELQRDISERRNQDLIGSKVRVLLDRVEGEYGVGRTEWDAPEIDQEVYVKNDGTLQAGTFYTAEIVDAVEYDLHAKIV